LARLESGLAEAGELLHMVRDGGDAEDLDAINKDLEKHEADVEALEFRRMFSGEMDPNNAFLDIQSGSGGTEAQDWADMLLRMYSRWAERRGYEVEIHEIQPGDEAGITRATLYLKGENAYGFAKAERGVHRLVRISPFDSNKRRHTSFCAVDVLAELPTMTLSWIGVRLFGIN
jgi:peptide chain release factor 2